MTAKRTPREIRISRSLIRVSDVHDQGVERDEEGRE